MCSAKRSITSSSVPEASPARTMVTNVDEKTLGNSASPSARSPPAMIRSRRRETMPCIREASSCAQMLARASSSGRPACSNVASWRAMAATAVLGTGWSDSRIFLKELLEEGIPGLATDADADSTESGTSPFSRTDAMACRSVSASTKPRTVLPFAEMAL